LQGVVLRDERAGVLAGGRAGADLGGEPVVGGGARPVAVAWRVEGDDGEAGGGAEVCAGDDAGGSLVLATAVGAEHESGGRAGGGPEHAGDAVVDEAAFGRAVGGGRFRGETHDCWPFGMAAGALPWRRADGVRPRLGGNAHLG
jgi:hypothetical protein